MSTLDQEFAAENSDLCIQIAQRDKEIAILRDLLARLLCWPVLDDLREGARWKREIADTLHSRMAATLSERSTDA